MEASHIRSWDLERWGPWLQLYVRSRESCGNDYFRFESKNVSHWLLLFSMQYQKEWHLLDAAGYSTLLRFHYSQDPDTHFRESAEFLRSLLQFQISYCRTLGSRYSNISNFKISDHPQKDLECIKSGLIAGLRRSWRGVQLSAVTSLVLRSDKCLTRERSPLVHHKGKEREIFAHYAKSILESPSFALEFDKRTKTLLGNSSCEQEHRSDYCTLRVLQTWLQ